MNATCDKPWRTSLRALPLALAAVAGPGQAAVYTGVWDPAYGQPFNDLGWRGDASYFVPDACVPAGSADIDNATACAGLATVTSASVEFYDLADPAETTLGTLVFDPSSMLISTLRYVGGQLTQLVSAQSNYLPANINLPGLGANSNRLFALDFTLQGPRLAWSACNAGGTECQHGFNDAVNFPPRFAITLQGAEVPEPATLWLSGLAVLALLGSRRRGAARS